MADKRQSDSQSMTDRLMSETNNAKISGWFKGAFAPVIQAVDEQTEATKALQRFMERNTRQNKNSIDILQDNIKSIEDLAAQGDKNAKELFKLMNTELKFTKETMDKIESGFKVSQGEATRAAKSLAKMVGLTEKTGLKLETGLENILEQNLQTAKDQKLTQDERKKAIIATIDTLKGIKGDLSHRSKEILKEMVEADYESKNVNKHTLDLFQTQVDELTKLSYVNRKVISGTLQEIDKKMGDQLTQAQEIAKAEKKQYESDKKDKPGFYDKSGLGSIVENNKAGFADAILAQLGLGGMGIGKFITDSERLKKMWEGVVEAGYKFKKFLGNIPANIKEGINAITDFGKKTIGKIKNVSLAAWEKITSFSNKLKSVGGEAVDMLGKYTKNLKNFVKSLFSKISEGFGKFWKDGLNLMKKGGGLIAALGSMIMSGLSAIFSGLLTGGSIAGGLLKSGAGALGGMVLSGGKKLGGALLGGGRMLGKGITKLGKFGSGALGGVLSAGFTGYEAYQDYQQAKANGASPEELRKLKGQGISKTIGSGVGGALGAGLGALTGPLAPLLVPVLGALGSQLGEWVGKNVYDFLDNGGAKKIMDGLKAGLDYVFGKDGILATAKGYFDKIVDSISLDNIKSVFSSITDSVSKFLGIDSMKETISKAIDSTKGLFSTDTIMDGIKSFVEAMFDGVKTAIISLLPGGQLGVAAVNYLKDWFSGVTGSSQTNDVNAPSQQIANPTPMGNVGTLDTTKTKSMASNNLVVNSSPAKQNAQQVPVPLAPSPGNSSSAGSNYRPTQVDDLSLATLNSILFE